MGPLGLPASSSSSSATSSSSSQSQPTPTGSQRSTNRRNHTMNTNYSQLVSSSSPDDDDDGEAVEGAALVPAENTTSANATTGSCRGLVGAAAAAAAAALSGARTHDYDRLMTTTTTTTTTSPTSEEATTTTTTSDTTSRNHNNEDDDVEAPSPLNSVGATTEAETGNHDSTTSSSSSSTHRSSKRGTKSRRTKTSSKRQTGNDGEDDAKTLDTDRPEDKNATDADDATCVFTVVILDVAQKKFPIRLTQPPSVTTVGTLKQLGAKIHKVSPDRQRLIYRGKMLQTDDETLAEVGITQDETILHLFPKPRVVIKDHGGGSGASTNNNMERGHRRPEHDEENPRDQDDDDDSFGGNGARVPTIVLDAEEAERRSQILVLGSSDYLEAQNNVKLFSFMLLIISSIELMDLLAVALGVPQADDSNENGDAGGGGMASPDFVPTIDDDILPVPNDDAFQYHNNNSWHYHNNNNNHSNPYYQGGGSAPPMVQTWVAANWVDLIISVMGVYVGILGIQATSHNTLRLAKHYLVGTVMTGVTWMIFNFIMTYELDGEEEARREEDHDRRHNPDEGGGSSDDDFVTLTSADLRWQAVSVMVLPAMVWSLCCLRAWQFQNLLMEAEQEAEERIRSEFATVVQGAASSPSSTTAATEEPDDGDDDEEEEEEAEPDTRPSSPEEEDNHAPADEELGQRHRRVRFGRRGRRHRAREIPNHEEELALQNESAQIS